MININILEHEGLVTSVISSNRYLISTSIDEDDLKQEGMIALMEAAQSYDETLGAFSTYAYKYIKWHFQGITKRTGDPIRKPGHLHSDYNKYRNAISEYCKIHGKEPDTKTITALTKLSADKQEIIQKSFQNVTSLDLEEGTRLKNLIPDERDDFKQLEQKLYTESLREDLNELMIKHLSTEQAKVIKLYYGWFGDMLNFTDIANILKVPSCEISRLYRRGMAKLKHPIVKTELTRKHGPAMAIQVYRSDENKSNRILGNMSKALFEAYVRIGNILKLNDNLVMITSIEAGTFSYMFSGKEYRAELSRIQDIEIKGEEVTKLYINQSFSPLLFISNSFAY